MAFSLLGYLEANFELRRSGSFVYLRCVFCDRPWKLWINVGEARPWGWCFRCQTWTDAVKLVMHHRGLDRFHALEFIKRGEHRESLAAALQRAHDEGAAAGAGRSDEKAVLPEEYEPLPSGSAMGKMAMRYLERRLVDVGQIAAHKIGFCCGGPYHGRVVVPITKDGKIAYFVARAFAAAGPKYLNPSKEALGVGKSEVIFNYDRARGRPDGVVGEGVFDAMAMGDGAMGILGKKASETQLRMLAGFKRLGVCLDLDAQREAQELVWALREGWGVDAYPMIPEGKDPSEAGGRASIGEFSFVDLIRERMGDP